jgi:hypothetical protein
MNIHRYQTRYIHQTIPAYHKVSLKKNISFPHAALPKQDTRDGRGGDGALQNMTVSPPFDNIQFFLKSQTFRDIF